ncbi:MAG: shikimate kinase [Duncaniella sp.]|nr:shikimate kinase [Duncaniella sp.]
MKPIFLIGYMCSGKTTLGRALEQVADVTYIDLDDMIVEEQGMSVSDIFASRGEEVFRSLEADALARIARLENVVVGCGGGTACRTANMELMNGCGTTVLLEACRDRLLRRLLEGRAGRPLIASLSDAEVERAMERGLAQRKVHYERARCRFDSSLLETPDEVAATVELFIKKFNIPQKI